MAPHIAPPAAPLGRRAGVRMASMGVTCRAGSHKIPTPPECAPFAVTRYGELFDPTLGALAPTLSHETQRKSTRLGMAHPEAVSSVVAPSKKSSAEAWPRDVVSPNITSWAQALAEEDAVVLHIPMHTAWGSLGTPGTLPLRIPLPLARGSGPLP